MTQYKKSAESKQAQGRRRYDRKQAGFGGQSKPILRRKAKTTKKLVLRTECSSCKWKHQVGHHSFISISLLDIVCCRYYALSRSIHIMYIPTLNLYICITYLPYTYTYYIPTLHLYILHIYLTLIFF